MPSGRRWRREEAVPTGSAPPGTPSTRASRRAPWTVSSGSRRASSRYEDLANYESRWEEPLGTSFHGYDVHAAAGWSQGPRIVLMLNMLENYDLRALGYNTPAYIHLVSQVINLAIADAHKYVADPDFAPPPENLYTKEYARERIGLIDEAKAFQDMPPWGDPAADGGGGGRRSGELRGADDDRRRREPPGAGPTRNRLPTTGTPRP